MKAVPGAAAPAKPGKGPGRFLKARQLLLDAEKASKNAGIKKGIAESLVLLQKRQFKPAEEKVGELKRTAALGGDNGDVVFKLVDAEDALSDLSKHAERAAAAKTKPKKQTSAHPAH